MGFLLLQRGTVLLHDEDDSIVPVKADILVENDRVSKIGPDLPVPENADIIDCTDKLISPGFIDTHHHLWQSALKGLFADCTFAHYLGIINVASQHFTAEDAFWGNLAGCMEAIDAGTTTVLDHAHLNWSPEHSQQAVAGTMSSGIRSIFAYTPTARLREHTPQLKFDNPMADWIMDEFEKMAKTDSLSNKDSRIQLGFGWDYYFLPKDVVIHIFNKVRSLGARVITSHSNIFKGDMSVGVPAVLHSYGLLDDRIVLSHGGSIKPEDAKLLQESKTYVSVTPNTEQSMAVGPSVCFREDLPGLDKFCSLGIDCHSATSSSIVNEMRTGLQFARGLDSLKYLKDRSLPDDIYHKVSEVFNMGTIQGARALGMDKDIGSIAVGKKADFAIFDTMSPAMFGAAQQDPVGAIVFHSSIGDVDTVIVDGQVRKQGGKLRSVNRFGWRDGDVFETSDELSWRDVAEKNLGIQGRMVQRLSENDTRDIGHRVAAMIHVK